MGAHGMIVSGSLIAVTARVHIPTQLYFTRLLLYAAETGFFCVLKSTSVAGFANVEFRILAPAMLMLLIPGAPLARSEINRVELTFAG